MIGSTIAHYRITAELGEGGMGAVYRATDTKLNREVAIKVLPDAFATDADRLMRFTREAQVLASLNHPNIAAVYGIEDRAIVMELVEGPTLAERIAAGPLGTGEAVKIALQIAMALKAAHERGIVHRDLKPANVKIAPGGVVKVLDFGLAKLHDPRDVNPATAPTLVKGDSPTIAGMILGTAGYMSPEQASGQPVDRRADIWAFGVVLWEMLCGSPLFAGETVMHTIADVMRSPIDLKKLPPQTPASLRTLIARCLDRDLKDRLQDIGEARYALDRYLANADSLDVPAAVSVLPPRRWPWITAVVLAVLVAIAALWIRNPSKAQALLQLEMKTPEGITLAPTTTQLHLAFSPDGTKLAFLGVGKGSKFALWLRNLEADAATMLPGTEGAGSPFWSPDGRAIAFFANGKLQRVNLNGSAPVAICTTNGTYGTWNQEGLILFASEGRIHKVRAEGGVPTPMFDLDAAKNERAQVSPSFLPDGKHFLYVSRASGSHAMIASLDGRVRRVLFPQRSSPVYFAPDPDSPGKGWLQYCDKGGLYARPFNAVTNQIVGDEVLIVDAVPSGESSAASAGGLLAVRRNSPTGNQLFWFGRDGEREENAVASGTVRSPRISPDQKMLAWDQDGAIWIYDLARKVPTRLTHEAGTSGRPAWMPDGKSLVYDAAREGIRFLGMRQLSGLGGEKRLHQFQSDIPAGVGSVSHDRVMAIYESPKTFFLTSDGKQVPFPESVVGLSAISPDGKWLLYTSTRGSATREVYVHSIPVLAGGSPKATGKFQISSGGGSQPRWRADGKEIFYLSEDRWMMAVPVESGEDFFRPGTAKRLFETRASTVGSYDVAADGQRFLIVQSASESTDSSLTLIVNWPKLLRK